MLFTKKSELKEELKRRDGRRQSMLRAFQKKGELSTAEINHFGTGCSSRIKELRKEGYVIVTQYEKPGQYRYIYLGNKAEA